MCTLRDFHDCLRMVQIYSLKCVLNEGTSNPSLFHFDRTLVLNESLSSQIKMELVDFESRLIWDLSWLKLANSKAFSFENVQKEII